MSLSQSEKFKLTLLDLFDFIIIKVSKKIDIKALNETRTLISLASGEFLINGFIEKSHKYWDSIRNKDQNFFIVNCKDVFELSEQSASTYVSIFNQEGFMLEEDKSMIWNYMRSLVRISIIHIHKSREPKVVDGNKKYSKAFFSPTETDPGINIAMQSQLWELQLPW